MKSVIYTVLALFWLTCELTVGNSDFFETSQSENEYDPSKDFFGEYNVEEKDSNMFKSDGSQTETKAGPKKQYNYKEDLLYKAYLSRIINIFLRSAGFSDDAFEDDTKTVKVDLTLSKEDFAILKKFGSDEEISLKTLENSFRSMFNYKNNSYIETVTSVFMEYLKYAILIALLIAIVVYIVFVIRKINFKISAISFMLFIAYFSIVLHGLLKQYEDISENIVMRRMEFENLASPPRECIYSKMTYLEKMYVHIFGDVQCQRFLQSRKSVWYEIDLVSAFMKPFQLIFSSLCSMLGEGSEKMIKPFIDRSPWPINVLLGPLATLMQLALLFFGIFLIFFTFTSRNISLKIPFIFSMIAEKKHEVNYDRSCNNSRGEVKSHTPEGSIKTYVVNHGGIVLLGNEDKQLQSFSIQRGSSLNFNSQPQSFKISQQSNGLLGTLYSEDMKSDIQRSSSLNFNSQTEPFKMPQQSSLMNSGTVYSEDMKSGSIFNKQLAINKKEVRRQHKKLTYFKKMNFKPNKRSVTTLTVPRENLDILPLP